MITTDYLVAGAGASALAFVDTLLTETDATVTLVDKRGAVGGHWTDAYPFVRLHQPSSYYGVASRPLGTGRIDTEGLNAGYEELATGAEVLAHFQAVLRERLLPSGRVRFLPFTEHLGQGRLRHLISGRKTELRYGRLVDATLCENGIPVTHQRKFTVEGGVACIAPNDLPRRAVGHDAFTVIGAGKTAMDSVIWLLEAGAAPEQIRWVVPRDPWMIDRGFTQPTGAFYLQTAGNMVKQLQALSEAESGDAFALEMEAAGIWMRLDQGVMPRIMHGPTVSRAEMARMRAVRDVVRMGHVTGLEPGRMVLEGGAVPAADSMLYVDCTARALGHTRTEPIFTEDRIGLQMVRLYQPTFSTALLAKIESLHIDNKQKNILAAPVPMTDTVTDWVRSQIVTTLNQMAWGQVPELREWIKTCRLDGFGRAAREVDREAPEVLALHGQIKALMMPAFHGMQRLAAGG